MKDISNRLITLRNNKTQTEFAKDLGIDQTYISRYERGFVKPTTEFYLLLNKRLDVNINWLLTGEGPMYIESSSTKSADNYINRIKELETQLTNLRSSMQLVLNETWDKSEKRKSKKNCITPLNKYGLLNEFQKN